MIFKQERIIWHLRKDVTLKAGPRPPEPATTPEAAPGDAVPVVSASSPDVPAEAAPLQAQVSSAPVNPPGNSMPSSRAVLQASAGIPPGGAGSSVPPGAPPYASVCTGATSMAAPGVAPFQAPVSKISIDGQRMPLEEFHPRPYGETDGRHMPAWMGLPYRLRKQRADVYINMNLQNRVDYLPALLDWLRRQNFTVLPYDEQVHYLQSDVLLLGRDDLVDAGTVARLEDGKAAVWALLKKEFPDRI